MNDFGGQTDDDIIKVCSPPAQSTPISKIPFWTRITAMARQTRQKCSPYVGLVVFGLLWFAAIVRLFLTI